MKMKVGVFGLEKEELQKHLRPEHIVIDLANLERVRCIPRRLPRNLPVAR
jgi:hypothetical protein